MSLNFRERPYLIFFALFVILSFLPNLFEMERSHGLMMAGASIVSFFIGVYLRHKVRPIELPRNQRLVVIGLQIVITVVVLAIMLWIMS